jgi:hypothetical protein
MKLEFLCLLPQDQGFIVPEEALTWKADEKGLGADLGIFERRPAWEKIQILELTIADLESLLRLDFDGFWEVVRISFVSFSGYPIRSFEEVRLGILAHCYFLKLILVCFFSRIKKGLNFLKGHRNF